MREQRTLLEVFIVEDDPDDRLLIQHDFSDSSLPIAMEFLRSGEEYQVIAERHSLEAKQSILCLVIVNTFPKEEFIEIIQQIREIAGHDPLLFIAGMIDAPWEASFYDMAKWSLVGLIVKPVTPKRLVEFLKEAPESALSSLDLGNDLFSPPPVDSELPGPRNESPD